MSKKFEALQNCEKHSKSGKMEQKFKLAPLKTCGVASYST